MTKAKKMDTFHIKGDDILEYDSSFDEDRGSTDLDCRASP